MWENTPPSRAFVVFEIDELDLLPEGRYHNNSDFFKFPSFNLHHLKDLSLPPIKIEELEEAESIFDKIKDRDRLIHIPYHSYESVIKFFEDADKERFGFGSTIIYF